MAQALNAPDSPPDAEIPSSFIEVGFPRVLVRNAAFQHVVDGNQHYMGSSHYGAFASFPRCKPMIPGREAIVLVRLAVHVISNRAEQGL